MTARKWNKAKRVDGQKNPHYWSDAAIKEADRRIREETRAEVGVMDKKRRYYKNLALQKELHWMKREKEDIEAGKLKLGKSVINIYNEEGELSIKLPRMARVQYGCINCDWKGTVLCPFGFTKKWESHANKICGEREYFLGSLTRSYKKRPTYAEWHKDYLINKASLTEANDYTQLQLLKSDIDNQTKRIDELEVDIYEYESGDVVDKDKLKMMKSKLDTEKEKLASMESKALTMRRDWHNLWKDIVKYEDTQVERDTPKKQDINVNRVLTIDQIHSFMRDGEEVVDVKEVDEDETKPE